MRFPWGHLWAPSKRLFAHQSMIHRIINRGDENKTTKLQIHNCRCKQWIKLFIRNAFLLSKLKASKVSHFSLKFLQMYFKFKWKIVGYLRLESFDPVKFLSTKQNTRISFLLCVLIKSLDREAILKTQKAKPMSKYHFHQLLNNNNTTLFKLSDLILTKVLSLFCEVWISSFIIILWGANFRT
jgi:hypothetical protein